MKIKAAVVRSPGQDFVIEEVDLAPPKESEVLVRMVACGICHSDAFARDQGIPVPLPAVLGHEGAGIIEKVGAAVSSVKQGDHVVLSYFSCGLCEACLTGHPSQCDQSYEVSFGGVYKDGTKRLSQAGEEISAFFGQSSFATYVVADERNVVKIDRDVDMALMSPLGCGIQTGAGTVINVLRPRAGSSLVVFGCGTVGLSAVMAAKISGCGQIIGVDIVPSRLELAAELGATHVVNSGEVGDPTAEIMKITGRGADYSLDTSAVPANITRALRCLKTLGTAVSVGSTGDKEVCFKPQYELMGGGKTLIGAIQGDSIPQLFIPRLVRFYQEGKLPLEKIVRFYEFTDINLAFADAHKGITIKPVIRFIC